MEHPHSNKTKNTESLWRKALKEEFSKDYFIHLMQFVEEERRLGVVYPPKECVFNAFTATPFEKVKVAILGQDPYHGPGQAHGLAFSVLPGVALPPSLKNIYKELHADIGVPIPKTGYLMPWAEQGVFLLNNTLTVRANQPLSHHGKGWEIFTSLAFSALLEREDPVIFVLWGKPAQKKLTELPAFKGYPKEFILTAPHPSPFSAHSGFFESRPFSKINDMLCSMNKEPIDWAL